MKPGPAQLTTRSREIDATRGDWAKVCEHCERSGHQRRREQSREQPLGYRGETHRRPTRGRSDAQIESRQRPARLVDAPSARRKNLTQDLQTRLDIAHDYARAGQFAEAITLLQKVAVTMGDLPDQS